MTPHDQIRRDQSLVLRDSLLGSSFSWLTIAVALLFAASLRSAPVVCELPPGILVMDERILEKILAIPDGGAATPVPVPTTTVDARVLPVDDPLLRDAEFPVTTAIAEPTTGPIGATDGQGGSGRAGTLDSAPGTATEVIPDADTWVYRDVEPAVATRVTPIYPELALQAHMEGRLVVRAYVGPDGRVRRVEAESGPEVFADAATSAVARWVFSPALANGHPVGVWVRVPVLFRLD